MKLVAVCWLLLLPWAQAQTLRLNWQPTDFQPLSSLPWKDTELHEVPKIVERIFREPNPAIRYPVLAEYLRQVPMLHFAAAFDVALLLEGTQTPNDLVLLMLRIWAQRDPQEAWERTQMLADLVGIEDGCLNYDSWNRRAKITVQNLAAIRASRYYLRPSALLTFPDGVEASEVSESEKARLLKAFGGLWFERFQGWPREPQLRYTSRNDGVLWSLHASPASLKNDDPQASGLPAEAAFEAGLRHWIWERKEDGPEIVQHILRKRWPADPATHTAEHPAIISREFLLSWSQANFNSLMEWQDSAQQSNPREVWIARCIMMKRVGKAIREKWLADIPAKNPEDHLCVLASWAPELAMERAVRTKEPEIIRHVGEAAVYGFGGLTWNRSHAGLGFINSFDLQSLPKEVREPLSWQWGITPMEEWSDVDAGEAARYGFRFLMQQSWCSKENLLRLFSGDDQFAEDASMIDRTFCALRVWAVLRPDEMRTWISKQSGADARKALTWLSEHPWGGDAKEVEKAKE